MTEAILDIKQWGNNLGVRLPAAIAREAHLHVDQRVRISVENNHVVITPIDDAPPHWNSEWTISILRVTAEKL